MPDPLSAGDRKLLSLAAELHRPLARAARIANTNGASLAVFGVLTLLLAAFDFATADFDLSDFLALPLGACLVYSGIVERRAGASLRNADPLAPRRLARNEVVLLAAITLYCVARLTVLRPGESDSRLSDALRGADVGEDLKAMEDSFTTAFYALAIIVTLLYQGGMARYFARRSADVARFHSEIPEWARTLITGI